MGGLIWKYMTRIVRNTTTFLSKNAVRIRSKRKSSHSDEWGLYVDTTQYTTTLVTRLKVISIQSERARIIVKSKILTQQYYSKHQH